MDRIISTGAEAVIFRKKDTIVKKRIPKKYRLRTIDERLRIERTRLESRIMRKARSFGINVPRIIDTKEYEIIMEYLSGDLLRDRLDTYNIRKREKVCRLIGKQLFILHHHGMVHGDPTTSNMILVKDDVFLVDFGLAMHSKRLEDKAVDLHLLKQALIARHNKNWEKYWKWVLKEYSDKNVLSRLEKVESRGRKKN